jgi:glycosyltransferase involved in cell wall biosynthesis
MTKVVVTPHAPGVPYQEFLHAELRRVGVTTTYLVGPTRSQTVNLLLRPLKLAVLRCRGYRVLHVHWVFDWLPSWAQQREMGRRAAEFWFTLSIRLATAIGFRLIWTAHNLLPHERTFHDDARARRNLIRATDAVITHSEVTRLELAAMGSTNVSVIKQGPYLNCYPAGPGRQDARKRLGLPDSGTVVLHFGALRWYKGSDRLLQQMDINRPDLTLVVAGECADRELQEEIESAASRCGSQVKLVLGFIPDKDLRCYLDAADAAIFPFRSTTNSASVHLALEAGLPVIVPDLTVFADLPAESTVRFDTTDRGLGAALRILADKSAVELETMGAIARGIHSGCSWSATARQTVSVYEEAIRRPRRSII